MPRDGGAIAFPPPVVHTPFVGGLSPEAAAHVRWLEQRGLASTTVYARARLLLGLQEWLACYGGSSGPVPAAMSPDQATSGSSAGPSGVGRARHAAAAAPRPGAPLLDATAADLAAWRMSLALAPGGICCYVSHARCFYDFAVAQGWIETNPAANLPVPRRPRRLPRPIGENDLERAMESAPRRIRPWLVLAGWAGFRAIEIAKLQRDSVLDTGPSPRLLVTAESTKGGRHERIVPMSPFVLAELRAAGLPAGGYVFRRHDGKPGHNTPHVISQLANEHLRDCGISETLHRLRHRFASQIYIQTHDLRLVQEMLGHQDPATTAGYAAYDRDGAAEAVAALRTPGRLRLVERTG